MAGIGDTALFETAAALPAAARMAFARDAHDNPFRSAAWFDILAQSCAVPECRPRILASADGTLLAPLALRLDRQGRHLESWSNFYSCDFSPLCGYGVPAIQAAGFASGLAALRPRIDTLHLRDMRADTVDVAALATALRRTGWWTRPYEQTGNWHEDVRGIDFDNYLASRDGKLRATIERRTRRFRGLPGATLTIAQDPAGLDGALDAYLAMHARSWKRPEPFPRFIPAFVRGFARLGMLRIGVASIEGRPVAAQIWLLWRRRATIVKLAHDEAARDLSPGTVLTAWMIRAALEAQDLDEIDFGRGDDPYKRHWLRQRRPIQALVAGNARTPRGLAAALRHLGPHAARRAMHALGLRFTSD